MRIPSRGLHLHLSFPSGGGRIVGIRLLRAVHLRDDIFGPTVYRGFKS